MAHTTIIEGRQQITFDARWRVSKWDQAGEFVGSMSNAFAGLHSPFQEAGVHYRV